MTRAGLDETIADTYVSPSDRYRYIHIMIVWIRKIIIISQNYLINYLHVLIIDTDLIKLNHILIC